MRAQGVAVVLVAAGCCLGAASARAGSAESLPATPRPAAESAPATAPAGDAPEAGGLSAGPGAAAADYRTTVRASPEATQDRVFGATRFWLLDPGQYEIEVWWDHKFRKDGSEEGRLKLEIEIGLAPHLQLDLYQNFKISTLDGFEGIEGNQLELRIAFGNYYNHIPTNPVLYLEWHPMHRAQDRAEVRLLLGGDLPLRGLWAANFYYETNVDDFDDPDAEGLDTELGGTVAASFAIVPRILRLGAEVRGGINQHGEPRFFPELMVGPNALVRIPPANLKLTVTALFGLMPEDPIVRMLVIGGWQF